MKWITWMGAAVLLCAQGVAMAQSDPTEVKVIAHRGASAYAPENTLAAFRLASEMKADFFELDCTLSLDGEVIVIHDDTLDRTTPLEGSVMKTVAAAIIALDAGSWFDSKFSEEKVPTLKQTLDFAKDTIGVYIEIKDSDPNDETLLKVLYELGQAKGGLLPDSADDVMNAIEGSNSPNLELTRKVIELVRERKMEDEVVIQSFSPIVCAVALIEAPEIRTELLAAANKDDPEMWPMFQEWGKMLQAHGFNCHKDLVTRRLVEEFHALGMSMAIWTVNDERDMKRLAEMGVDSLITDRPDVCLSTLGR